MLYLNSNGLLSCNQFRFRKGHSAEDQLLFYGQVSESVSLGYCVDVVYLDFLKDLNLVSHDVLAEKLRCLRVDASMLEIGMG